MANEQTQKLAGDWNQLKGALKKRWGQLTDQDFMGFEGDAEQLIGLIQCKTGEARDQIEKFLKQSSSDASSMVQQVTSKASELAESAQEQVTEAYGQLSERVQEGYEAAEKHVRENPVQAVAVAFGAGVLVGVIAGVLLRSR